MATTTVSQIPTEIDFDITIGDHIESIIPVTTEGGGEADLTDYTPAASIVGRDKSVTVTPTVTKQGSNLVMSVTPAQSGTLGGTNVYEIELANADRTDVITIVRGAITTAPDFV